MIKKADIVCIIAIISVFFVLAVAGMGCPIKYFMGISCAGCGMTRAWLSVVRFDFSSAFAYHPLFLLPPVFIAVHMLREKIGKKAYKTISAVFIIMFLAMYLIRLCNPQDNIVVCDIRNGVFIKIIKIISGG